MSMLKFAAGVDVRSSGDCGLCLGWRARKPSPCALRSSHTPARVGRATDIKPHLLDPGLCLSLHLSLLFTGYEAIPRSLIRAVWAKCTVMGGQQVCNQTFRPDDDGK